MEIFAKKRESGTTVLLHIGSSTIGSMAIRHWKDGKIEILAHNKITTNFLLDVDFQAFWRSVQNAMKNCLDDMQKKFKGRPDLIICTFTSPWFISQTKIVSVKRAEEFSVDEELFNQLIKNEIEIFLRHWQGNMEPLKGRANLIEYKIMKVNLNGYPTQKPLNRSVKNLEAYLYISLGVNEVMETIKKEVAKNFGNVPVQFHTFPYVAFSALGGIINTDDGLLFIEMGGETTDISLVRKNVLEETISFRRGKNILSRRLSSDLKTFIEEIPSVLEAFHKNQLNEDVAKKVRTAIDESTEDWLKMFEASLKMISENFPLPQNLYIIGEDLLNIEITSRLEKNTNMAQYTVFEKPFNVIRIKTELLEKFFSNKEFYDMKKDIFLSMEAIFADSYNVLDQK